MSSVLYRCCWRDKNEGSSETFSQQDIEVLFEEYPIIKETDKTYTVRIGRLNNGKYGDESKTTVLKDQSGKRFAYTTKKRALEAFLIKRHSYGRKLKQAIKNNDRLIGVGEELMNLLKTENNGN